MQAIHLLIVLFAPADVIKYDMGSLLIKLSGAWEYL
jgi:hypothetical protein